MSPRKKEAPAAPLSLVDKAMANLAKMAKKERMNITYNTPVQQMEGYRWIDFCDPIRKQPALLLEILWGARGFLTGRMLKIEAAAGVGKSSFTWLMYAMAQQMPVPAFCNHYESEGATAPPDFIASFGCNPRQVLQVIPDVRSIDACLNAVDDTTRKYRLPLDKDGTDPDKLSVIVVGVDSVSGFSGGATEEDEKMEMGKGGLGFHARCISQWFRDKWVFQEKRDVFMLMVTQVRAKIETGGFGKHAAPTDGNENTTIAGTPLNYHSSYRMEMHSAPLKLDEPPYTQYGEKVTFKTTRNKLSPKGVSVTIPLIWNHGFDFVTPTIEWLAVHSPIELPNGSMFDLVRKGGGYITCELLGITNSRDPAAVLDALYANEPLLMGLREALRIRGYGFAFETAYQMSPEEIEDNTPTEPAPGVPDAVA